MLDTDLYLYFLGLSYRNTSRHYLDSSKGVMYPSGNGFKGTDLKRIKRKRKRTMEFIIDETMIKD